jgi:chromosome segregation ATPase
MRSALLFLLSTSLLVAVTPTPLRGQETPPPQALEREGASTLALQWERDFDLLYDLEGADPAREAAETRRRALELERQGLDARIGALRERLGALEGSYSTELLLREMLTLDVGTLQEVQAVLRRELAAAEGRRKEVEEALRKLPGGRP